jgi:hypothetical protein
MMERGEFTTTKVRNTKTVRANVVIFATSNSTERLSKPLLSRFTVYEIPEYTYEEFEGIALRIIKELHPNTVIQVASSVWKKLGLGIARFDRDFLDRRYSSHIDEDIQSAKSSGVKSNPTFFINGDRYDGAWDLDSLLAALDEESVFSWRQTKTNTSSI